MKYYLPKLFTPSSLKVIEYLLITEEEDEPEMIHISELAEKLDLSVGSISKACKHLSDLGFINIEDKKRGSSWYKYIELDESQEVISTFIDTFRKYRKYRKAFEKK